MAAEQRESIIRSHIRSRDFVRFFENFRAVALRGYGILKSFHLTVFQGVLWSLFGIFVVGPWSESVDFSDRSSECRDD